MNTNFVPQEDQLWVGMQYGFDAISGRVIGWRLDTEAAPELARWPRAPWLEEWQYRRPSNPRGRAVVLIHASTSPDNLGLGPIVTIDANWPARFVADSIQAWRVALQLQREFEQEMLSKGMMIEGRS